MIDLINTGEHRSNHMINKHCNKKEQSEGIGKGAQGRKVIKSTKRDTITDHNPNSTREISSINAEGQYEEDNPMHMITKQPEQPK